MVEIRVELFMVLVCYYISTSLNMSNRRLNLHRQEKIYGLFMTNGPLSL